MSLQAFRTHRFPGSPRIQAKASTSGIPVDHNGAEPLYDRVGERIKSCRLALISPFSCTQSVPSTTPVWVSTIDPSFKTKTDAEGAAARLRFPRIQHRIHLPSHCSSSSFGSSSAAKAGSDIKRQRYERATGSHRCLSTNRG